jgi:hypothetical protein
MALINKLSAIGDAIREKTGKEDLLTLEQMPEEIRGISGGSSGEEKTDLFSYIKTSPQFDPAFSEITEPVVFHLEKANSIANMFFNVYLHCPKITIYVSNTCTNMTTAFRYGASDAISTIEEIEIIGDSYDFKKLVLENEDVGEIYRYDIRNNKSYTTSLKYDKTIKEYGFLVHQDCMNVVDYGRILGNISYIEGK